MKNFLVAIALAFTASCTEGGLGQGDLAPPDQATSLDPVAVAPPRAPDPSVVATCGFGCEAQVVIPRLIAGSWTPNRAGVIAWIQSTEPTNGLVEIPVGQNRRLVRVDILVANGCSSFGTGFSISAVKFGIAQTFTPIASTFDSDGAAAWRQLSMSTTTGVAIVDNDSAYVMTALAQCAGVKLGALRVWTDLGHDIPPGT